MHICCDLAARCSVIVALPNAFQTVLLRVSVSTAILLINASQLLYVADGLVLEPAILTMLHQPSLCCRAREHCNDVDQHDPEAPHR
jgi:hypothetical protein